MPIVSDQQTESQRISIVAAATAIAASFHQFVDGAFVCYVVQLNLHNRICDSFACRAEEPECH